MVAAVESMAYAGTVPWHGLGNPINDNLTPAEMVVAAGLDWRVDKVPLGVMAFDEAAKAYKYTGQVVPEKYALRRNTDGKILSLCGKQYKPVQNEDAFDIFQKFVKAGHMKLETAGSLKDGKFVWGLAKIDQAFKVGSGKGKDEVQNYLLLLSPFEQAWSLMAMYTSVRVVCWNTLSAALGQNLAGSRGQARNDRQVFRMPHSSKFDDEMKAKAELALGLATEQVVEFKALSNALAKVKLTDAGATEFFFNVLKVGEKERVEIAAGDARKPIMLAKFEDALVRGPGAQLASAEGTLWGALNAVTYVIDHEVGRTRDAGLSRAWIGEGSIMKRFALRTAAEMAKAA